MSGEMIPKIGEGRELLKCTETLSPRLGPVNKMPIQGIDKGPFTQGKTGIIFMQGKDRSHFICWQCKRGSESMMTREGQLTR